MAGNGRGGIQDGRIVISTVQVEKLFFLFLPSRPHIYGSNALFIGVSVVRVSVRVSVFTLTLTLIPSWISPAIVRSVSLRLQYEGQKNSRIAQMHTESLTRIFLTFVSDANRFQTDLQALPLALLKLRLSNILSLVKQVPVQWKSTGDVFFIS